MQLFTNNAISKLAISININDLILSVLPGTGNLFPQPVNSDDFFLVTLEDEFATKQEILKITQRTGDVFTIGNRGWEGTTAYSWTTDDYIDHRHTAGTIDKFEQERIPGKTTRNLLITAGSTVVCDTYLTTTEKKSCKWLITLHDNIDNKIAMFEMLAVHKGSLVAPDFNRYGRVGDKILHSVNVQQSGSLMQLSITNNELHNVSINILRIEYL